MKKIFTLAVLAVSALSASAVTLWEGSCSFTNYQPLEGEERPVLASSDFADVAVGDRLVFSISEYGDADWRAVELWLPDMSKNIGSSGNVTGLSSYTFMLDEVMLGEMQTNGVAVGGTGYTVTKIELIATEQGVIWEGECICVNWDAAPPVRFAGSAFVNAKEGDELVFYVEVITPGEWAAIQIDTSNWTAGPFGQNSLTAGQTEVRFVLNSELLSSLQNDGINVTGANFKLTKIKLVSGGDEGGDEGDDEGDEGDDDNNNDNVIWSGNVTVTSWDNTVTLGGDAFGNLQAGDRFAFTVTEGDANSSIGIRSNPGWGDIPSDNPDGDYIYLVNGPGVYYWEINEAAAEEINNNGMVITGTAFTITKIELIPKGVESGVEVLGASAKNAAVYNLNGVKVANGLGEVTAPGIYVSGGKKYVVK